ncbi:diacylglycerol kinase eta isoform X1 [Photinus pyralis]|nr:diacylglycerol kinase eta isoform X1 [Photinus pyralis]
MEEWLAALTAASQRRFHEPDQPDFLSGYHHWYATSHARPTYCNVCREALHGVTSHGLSCEVCKCKVHKRCAAKAINNCKWTTLSSVGKDIIEEADGNITMPHQWMEGNLPVSAKCIVCDKTCGSVLRLQDWRCLWCRATVHTQCRPTLASTCPLGPARVSVVPPTSLHSVSDEAWEVVRPQASSPLLVFVNSKSGDNQGVKFLRRFKQLLNPAQVFDLISTGPRLGLRLFRHFDPFRILVCSGDGSVGWVLSEIDKLDMHKQCQVAVLPLGTGNDLARVLGWGSSCDDDTHLPQLLEKYEKASTKILDRWSVMTFERTIAMPKLSLDMTQPEGQLHSQISQYEDNLILHLQNILQSDDTSTVLNSAKRLCETVKDFATQVSESSLIKGDEQLSKKCDILQQKLEQLLQTLTSEQLDITRLELDDDPQKTSKDDTESEISFDKAKVEKELSNFNFRKHRRTSRFVEREKEALLMRANSLKRAIRSLVEHTEQAVDEQNKQTLLTTTSIEVSVTSELDKTDNGNKMDCLKVLSTIESASSSEVSLCPTPSSQTSSIITTRLATLSPMPDFRRDSTCDDPELMQTLPVPPDFADSRRASQVHQSSESDMTTATLIATCSTLATIQDTINDSRLTKILEVETVQQIKKYEKQRRDSTKSYELKEHDHEHKVSDDDKECGSIISTEEMPSEVVESKSFCPRKGSDGEDVNGHIYHIDSPETDTYPNSEALHGESLLEDMSSVLGQDFCGLDQDSIENSYTDDTTLFNSDLSDLKLDKQIERKKSLKRNSIDKMRRTSITKIDEEFGFENRAFTTQNMLLDNRYETEPVKYCSLAQFEGNDISRRSFKKVRTTSKVSKTEANVNRQSTLTEESESSVWGSRTSLNKADKDMTNSSTIALQVPEPAEKEIGEQKTEDRPPIPIFPQVIVEPPSPVIDEQIRADRIEKLEVTLSSDYDLQNLCSKNDHLSSPNSSNSNLLGGEDQVQYLSCSPAATRRISCCSLLNPAESAALAATAAATSRFYSDMEKKEKREENSKKNRKLPIINPLVRLPAWPNVSTGAGFISKCLLANADTLCAAVGPLMDPDESLMEGFFERCVMNNYFGIGIDAKISLDFHHKREEHPEKCRSRAKNYMWYGVLGSKQFLQKTYKNLGQRVQLECDGQRIPLPSLQGIVILNIPSFMGGTNFWGGSKEDDIFLAPSFDDKILEVVAVFGSVQMAASRLINLQHHRIAQCQSIQINILGDEGVPIQVDGEAWVQPPGIIRILHKNRMQMLCRNRALESSLKTWEEKQRQSIAIQEKRNSISHDKGRYSLTRQSMPVHENKSLLTVPRDKRQHSFSGVVPVLERSPSILMEKRPSMIEPEILFTDEERFLLISFIECATNLTKWIKLLAISYTLEVDLYSHATKTDLCLEKIHPNGKIIEGPSLRVQFTKLVGVVKELYEESCCLLHDRGHKLKLREDLENKLSMSLANMEMELRKCFMYESTTGSMVYLQVIQEDHGERKRKGLFWLKFRTRGVGSFGQQQSSCKTARDVASWGTQEVATWLETLQLSEYIDSFVKNDIRGRELLGLARRDLKDLGVTKVGHVKRILQAIKDLTQSN